MPRPATFASLVCSVLFTGIAHAAITVNFSESGGNVVAAYSGSLDLTGTTYQDSYANPGGGYAVAPGSSSFVIGISGNMDIHSHYGDTGITSFGSGTDPVYADSSTGDLFACMVFGGTNYNLFLPAGYESGTVISGAATWNGTTIAAMGLVPDTSHVFTLPNDSFAVNIGSSVPEPSAAALLAFAGLAASLRRRRA